MRVSTQMIFESGVSNMQKRTSETLKIQEQLATNRRILTPSDDPVASAQALEVTQAQSLNSLYVKNQGYANDSLGLSENQLQGAQDLLQRVHELTVQIANSTLSDNDRKSVTSELRQRFDELMGIANQQDGTGNYLFSGFKGDTKPFTGTVDSGVTYNGDDGQRLLQVSPARNLAISDSGRDIFLNVPDKSTPFTTGTNSQNTGTGVISAPTISDSSKWNSPLNPKYFTIKFAVVGTTTTYDIVDNTGISVLTNTTASNTPPLPATYQTGGTIDIKALSSTVGGMDFGASVVISGSPANGDSFTIKPTGPVSIFDSIASLIHAAEQPLGSDADPATKAAYKTQVDTTLANVLSAQDNIDRVRSGIGARMSELDSLGSAASQRELDYKTTLSRLQDVDMTAAISNLTQTQTTLQAAQLSFSKISQLSLFQYL